jgi:hypothetical protein
MRPVRINGSGGIPRCGCQLFASVFRANPFDPPNLPPTEMYTAPLGYRPRRRGSSIPVKQPASLWQHLAYLVLAMIFAGLAVAVAVVMAN